MNTDTYIMVGVALPDHWGYLPTDGQGDVDRYDDWHDRYGELIIYEPKRDDYVLITNTDGFDPIIGRVVKMDKGKWSNGTEFFEAYDVERLAREIAEVSAYLSQRYGVTEQPKLHIRSIVT